MSARQKQSSRPVLRRLSHERGIISVYRATDGAEIEIDDGSREAMLAAMGIDASTEELATKALRAEQERAWHRLLEPVRVAYGGDFPLRLVVRPPQDLLPGRWVLSLKSDDRLLQHGPVRFFPRRYRHTSLGPLAECEFDFEAPRPLAPGYYTIELRDESGRAADSMSLIVCPTRAFACSGRLRALAIQNYALHSKDPSFTGCGSLREIRSLAARFPEHRPGLSPLHALFYDQPERRSPYAPSSRLWLTPFLLDYGAIPEFAECGVVRELLASADFETERRAAVAGERVPYAKVAALRERILLPLFEHFQERHMRADTTRARQFRRFERAGGKALDDHALFEALHESRHAAGLSLDPDTWPVSLTGPTAEGARIFARENEERIRFFKYLQWNAAAQVRDFQRELRSRKSGLYLDLAIGAAPDGSEVWCDRVLYARSSIGSPPDAFAPGGQNWGLAPFEPAQLRERAYRPFIDLLRANMPRAGILRVDHIMGLARLYWNGTPGASVGVNEIRGAYVRYPFHDLAGILALESQRRRTTIIGEDLGTLPDNMRAELHDRRIYSFRVLYFEKNQEDFIPLSEYPALAAASINTHDLPTLRGFLKGYDIELRRSLGQLEAEQARALRSERTTEVAALYRLAGIERTESDDDAKTAALFARLIQLLETSAAQIIIESLHDILGESAGSNLPGTVDEYPNWMLRYSRPVEEIEAADAPDKK